MQFQAGIPDPDGVETSLYHLQRGHLLGDEQHLLVGAHGRRDEVGDSLRLAGARRPLDDEVPPLSHLLYRNGL